jgi:chromatin structure-remodeling complex subunit RSC58
MTKDSNGNIESILQDLFTVYQNADKKSNILTYRIPGDFFEADSGNIIKSFFEFTGGKTGKLTDITTKFRTGKYVKSPYNLYHDIKVASCSAIRDLKVGSDEYLAVDFFYKFSTELLLQELSRINVSLFGDNVKDEYPSELATQLDQDFTKISYSYSAANDEIVTFVSKTEEPEQPPVSAYSNVYLSLTPPPTKRVRQPLFSSLVKKSSLDTRPTVVDDPYSIAKVVPLNKNTSCNNSTLDTISAPSNKLPTPMDQNPSALLQDFFHPIWYTIPVPTWLNYKTSTLKPASLTANQLATPTVSQDANANNKPKLLVLQNRNIDASLSTPTIEIPGDTVRSFAPNVDLGDSVVTEAFKSRIWLQHLGFNEIEAIKKKYADSQKQPQEKVESPPPAEKEQTAISPSAEAESVDSNTKLEQEQEQEQEQESKHEVDIEVEEEGEDEDDETEDKVEDSSMEIDVANLVNWDPVEMDSLKSLILEKNKITESPKSLQRLISVNLIKLNRLRQERYLGSESKFIALPSDQEKGVYNRLSKLIEIAIQLYNVSPGDFSFEFSKKLPVLTTEFSGTLPGIPMSKVANYNPTPQHTTTSTRLPSIRGPYKKKNKV